MTMTTPERTMGTKCGAMVEKGHIGYQCSLAQGHESNHNEPHFAIEVDHSVRAWNTWNNKRQASAQAVVAPEGGLKYTEDFEEEEKILKSNKSNDFARLGGFHKDPMEDVNAAHMKAMGLGEVKLGEPITERSRPDFNLDRCKSVYGKNAAFRCVLKGGHADGHLRGTVRWPQQDEPIIEPTKQRDGDQVLPTGGQRCVQDLVIEKMQESKHVGAERYGSPLMTFNGRKGIQDVAEEARDLFVYITAIEAEAQADRDTLIGVVQQAFLMESRSRQQVVLMESCLDLATLAVDRIMGWVTGQGMTRAR